MFSYRNLQNHVAGAMLLCVVAGCSESGFESQFVESDVVTDLMPEARDGYEGHEGVSQVVADRFGTPQELKIWLKMPLNIGGTKGAIAKDPRAEGRITSLTLNLEGDLETFEEQQIPLQFVSGEAASQQVILTSYDADSGVAKLETAMETPPAAGDQLIINGGETLRNGRRLYQRHCSHCHGTSGDGQGPTAVYMTPRPRDYRNGLFKFTRTPSLKRPARADIERTLRKGIPGTYMPSFVPMLKDNELTEVIEYVRYLAMRGEYERKLAAEMAGYTQQQFDERREDGESRAEILEELKEFYVDEFGEYTGTDADDLADSWVTAEDPGNHVKPSVPRIADTPESRRRGRELFVGAKLNCVNCHGIGGKGNGPQTTEYEIVDKKPRPLPGLHDEWGHVVKPRDLTSGIYRGGRRPIDIFRRLYSGINGAKMPAFGGKVSDEELWDVVNYVLSVPYEVEPGHAAPAAEKTTAGL